MGKYLCFAFAVPLLVWTVYNFIEHKQGGRTILVAIRYFLLLCGCAVDKYMVVTVAVANGAALIASVTRNIVVPVLVLLLTVSWMGIRQLYSIDKELIVERLEKLREDNDDGEDTCNVDNQPPSSWVWL